MTSPTRSKSQHKRLATLGADVLPPLHRCATCPHFVKVTRARGCQWVEGMGCNHPDGLHWPPVDGSGFCWLHPSNAPLLIPSSDDLAKDGGE